MAEDADFDSLLPEFSGTAVGHPWHGPDTLHPGEALPRAVLAHTVTTSFLSIAGGRGPKEPAEAQEAP